MLSFRRQRFFPSALVCVWLLGSSSIFAFLSPSNYDSLSTRIRLRLDASADLDIADDPVGIEAGSTGNRDVEVKEAVDLGKSELSQFFDFPLDDWQLQAGGEILKGNNVIVCAPTGSGKTVIGEMALQIAYGRDLNGIYTTPLKALSNQKYTDLRQIFGSQDVGLSTGDISINRQNARLTVMTTEVYRNIAWRSSGGKTENEPESLQIPTNLMQNNLDKNAVVVLDEFHYMGIPGRGGVWEECVITSPPQTQIIALSATLPNAKELAEWMEGVTNRKTVLIEAPGARPVPLRYLFATREGLYPLFRNPDAGPGSPLGMLGYRGDGFVLSDKTNKKRKGFGSKKDKADDEEDALNDSMKIPRGLQVNPALKAAAQRRMQRVNRRLEQQRLRQKERLSKQDEDWDLYSDGRRGGGRWRERGKMSAREERREKERLMKSEMRKAVPSLPILLTRLNEKNLLPAIFFIFSRAGCDNAAQTIANTFKGPRRDPTMEVDFEDGYQGDDKSKSKKKRKSNQRGRNRPEKRNIVQDGEGRNFRLDSNYVSEDVISSVFDGSEYGKEQNFDEDSPLSSENWEFYSTAGLLDIEAVQTVASRVARFNEDNPEISFSDEVTEQFLFGVGSHHAGILPAHKAFVETLYKANLMKAIFATETLAAGINLPARTTVICALAKRGDSSAMNLLETANLLQMSGRAGRRGMDTAGTCVIMATPFESHEEAATILTNPIKPVVSQFRPSYSLAVNLVARGGGKLDVARQLVKKSFAMWEKQQLENDLASASRNDGVSDVLEASAQEKFMAELSLTLRKLVNQRSARYDVGKIETLLAVLDDRELLKKNSKAYLGAVRLLELEQTTLGYLELELKEASEEGQGEEDAEIASLRELDRAEIQEQVEAQRQRAGAATKELRRHPFTSIVSIANDIMESDGTEGRDLFNALRAARDPTVEYSSFLLSGEELTKYSKASIVVKRRLRKLATANPDLDPEALLMQAEKADEIKDDSWEDMLAITKTLLAYGCLQSQDEVDPDDEEFENNVFDITPAGADVGMLGFENSLWTFVAVGGTCDIIGASAKLDAFKKSMQEFEDDEDDNNDSSNDITNPTDPSPSHTEAESLVSSLKSLSVGELAGYVSCLVSEGSRGGSPSVIDTFRQLSPKQQRVIQISLGVMERLVDVQRRYAVDERTCNCNLDITNCEVVTAWADGCSWTEALEISGLAPGDLVRILSRAMDATRQLGNLKYNPLRKDDLQNNQVDPLSRGIHPQVRRLCREAAKAMNRYPVKDQLFQEDDEDSDEDQDPIQEDEMFEDEEGILGDVESPGDEP